jgi:hypothetical protein
VNEKTTLSDLATFLGGGGTPADLAVKVATTAVLPATPTYDNGTLGVGATLTRSSNGTTGAIDGVAAASLVAGDYILVKNQAAQLQNGVYEITQQGTASLPYILTRVAEADTSAELDDLVVTAALGTTNKGIPYGQQTNNPIIGTNNIVFTATGIYMRQQTSGTQAINQIPVYTATGLTQTKGTANFKYNPANDLFTIRGIDYTFPANNGDASQVLTTDGAGNLSWATGGGGSSPITIGTSGNTLYSSGFANTGEGDTTIGNNIFLGDSAGELSNSVSYSNLFGFGAGAGISGSIQNMNVFGRLAGLQANNSANSNFIGVFAGSQSTNSFFSNFIGADAGHNADQSFCANFIGAGAGSQSENSSFSNFIGYQAGNNMTASYANDSIFIGTGAGAGDNISNYGQISYSSLSGTFTVGEAISSSSGGSAYIMFDNGSDLRIANVQGDFNINDTITGDDSGATANLDYFETSKSSILVGNNTSTGDYYNSIAIGNGATNTENNQMIIESTKGLERFKLKLDQTQQSAVTFTGSGLDDLTVAGTFSGTVPTTYTVTVNSINLQTIPYNNLVGGTFTVGNTVSGSISGATGTILSDDGVGSMVVQLPPTPTEFIDGDVIDNGFGVTADASKPDGRYDTFDWTDGTNSGTDVSMSTSPISLSNGLDIVFSSITGHKVADSWTWTYSKVQNNILDFSNGTYKFGTDFGTDYFGYEVGNNIFGFKGAVNTYTNTAGDSMITGYTDATGLGLIGFISLNSYSTGEIASMSANKNGVGYSMQDSFGENVVQTSSGITTVGNISGGNNTKITIDDVNEHITISNLPAYDDDTAAGVGGLTAGMVYMTTGSGSAPLNAAGILMIKQ